MNSFIVIVIALLNVLEESNGMMLLELENAAGEVARRLPRLLGDSQAKRL